MNTFENLGMSQELLQAVQKLGFAQPTKIQVESVPSILAGKDVIGESATGSGKTLAFGCGIIDKVTPKQGLQALVMTPTRELAEQVKDSLRSFSGEKRLNIIAVYGGVSINPQIDDLRRADVVVGTPGRILDHLDRRTINLSKVRLLVLDEADRMLDMGFIEDVETIIRSCPKERQTLFFSATLSHEIKELANHYMNDPVKVSASTHVDPSKLKQIYYDISRNLKLSLLVHMLQNENSGLVMVFCNTRRTVDFVVKNLKSQRIKALAIHGGLSQNKRTSMIKMFNDAKAGVLVCTDVAARGLDIPHVSHVYNYDIPKDAKEYVHRIGRTARAGEEGIVINLLCDYDYDNFGRVMKEYPKFNIQTGEAPRIARIPVKMNDEREERSGDRQRGRTGHHTRERRPHSRGGRY
ncbi:ATP-dependent RNA helicase [Candidatus Woesearchaeota archaeon CG10_big_fil_rev_8_21_14_0_10_45_16]|nr:MAG: ATP-dependent RNA helicase [Candidatus Woesearchaeota archaeon CG10_big_fil_rev_8_21_14_0_10_45_16]